MTKNPHVNFQSNLQRMMLIDLLDMYLWRSTVRHSVFNGLLVAEPIKSVGTEIGAELLCFGSTSPPLITLISRACYPKYAIPSGLDTVIKTSTTISLGQLIGAWLADRTIRKQNTELISSPSDPG